MPEALTIKTISGKWKNRKKIDFAFW